MAKKYYDENGNVVKVKKRGGCLSWIVMLVVLVFVINFFLPSDETESNQNTDTIEVTEIESSEEIIESETSEVVESESVEEASLSDDPIEAEAMRVFGDDFDDYSFEEGIININAQIGSNLTTSMAVRGFELKIIELAEGLSDENFNSLLVTGYTDFVNQYGNEENSRGYFVELPKETIDKINFDNFILDNLDSISNQYWVHPALE